MPDKDDTDTQHTALIEKVNTLVLETYFLVRRKNPGMSKIECERKAVAWLHDIINQS